MGMELAKAFVTVKADASSLPGELGQIKNMLADGLALESAFAYIGLEKLTRALGEFIDKGSEFHDVMETMEVDLMHLAGDATPRMLKGLTQFSDRANIGIKDVMSMARGFIQLGHSTEDVVAQLELLGNASGGQTEKFKKLTNIYRMMQAGTFDFRRAFRMLSREGFITAQDLAKHFGVTERAAKKMVKEGKVSFTDFQNILKGLTGEGGRMEGALTDMADAGTRIGDHMKEVFTRVARAIYEPLDKYSDKFAKEMTKIGLFLEKVAKYGGEPLAFAIKGAQYVMVLGKWVAAATAAFYGLNAALLLTGRTALTVGQFIRVAFIGSGIGAAVVVIGMALGFLVSQFNLLDGAIAIWDGLVAAFTNNNIVQTIYDIMTIFDRFVDMLGIAWNAVVDLFASALRLIGIEVTGWGEWLMGAFGSVWEGITGGIAYVTRAFLEMMEWLQVVMQNFTLIFLNFGDLVTYVMLVVADSIENALRGAFDSVKGMFSSFFSWLNERMADAIVMLKNAKSWVFDWKGLSDEEKEKIRSDAVASGIFNPEKETEKVNTAEDFLNNRPGLMGTLMKLDADKTALEGQRRGPEDLIGLGKTPPGEKEGPKGKGGMFDIAGFGKKVQQDMLEKDGKMEGLLQVGNDIQQAQLDAQLEGNQALNMVAGQMGLAE